MIERCGKPPSGGGMFPEVVCGNPKEHEGVCMFDIDKVLVAISAKNGLPVFAGTEVKATIELEGEEIIVVGSRLSEQRTIVDHRSGSGGSNTGRFCRDEAAISPRSKTLPSKSQIAAITG